MANVPVTSLRKGKYFQLEGEVYRVLDYSHTAMGRGGATIRVKVQGLKSGAQLEKTFRSGETVEEAFLENVKAQYLYADGDSYVFMNQETYEQYAIGADFLGDNISYLKDNLEVSILFFEQLPIGLSLPPKIDFRVASTQPGVKGDTATQAFKPATIETGLEVQVPLFIEEGDEIVVNTNEGSYVEKKK